MDFLGWLNNEIIANGLLCEEYTEKVHNAKNRKQMFDICCDTNGLKFIPEMQEAGHPLPYEVICKEFKSFINGRYTSRIEHEDGGAYTSQIYCSHTEEIIAEATGLCLLDCKCNIIVPEKSFVYIVVDSCSEVKIFRPQTSDVKVIPYGDAKIEMVTI